ncbi:MAG: FAD-dependent monooxygenase [Pseudomonadota bacterium]
MKTKALIVGGGIAGLTLAALLDSVGLDCIVIDKGSKVTAKDIKNSGRTAALLNSSIHVLEAAGVWNQTKEIASPLKQMRLKDDGNPDLPVKEVLFPANDIGLDQFGFNVPNLGLKKALQEHLAKQKSVKVLYKSGLESYECLDHGIKAKLDNGKTIEADIIIGCDGRGSPVRTQTGIQVKEVDYDQIGITFLIQHDKPHNNISTEHHRPGGPFTFVPMKEHESAIVWVEKSDQAKEYLDLSEKKLEKVVQEKSNDLLGEISIKTAPESWPIKSLTAEKLIGKRCALAAEAAHVMSPIGAQGLNLSLRDIAALAETLTDAARQGEDIGSDLVLKRYARRRKIDMASRTDGIDKFNKIVSNNIGFLRGVRRSGLEALNKIPQLKQLLMHQGLAPALDEGRLTRGEAL